MAPRRRTYQALLVLAALVVAPWFAFAGPAAAQDTGVAVTTSAADAAVDAEAVDTAIDGESTGQTLTQSTEGSDERIVTESRKVLAIIVALVGVAICLTLLTVRYWRNTKPVAPTPAPAVDPDRTGEASTKSKRSRRASGRRSRRSVAGADHASADTDWEPRGTGEHVAIEAPGRPAARPGRAARRRALGIDADG